jgi:Tol biopolymer transport system component
MFEPLEDRRLLSVDLVSVGLSGASSNHNSDSPCISGDGRYVAFESNASNLVAGDTNGYDDIFVRDLIGGATTRVSVDSEGNEFGSMSQDPSVSEDGRYVALCYGTAVIYVADLVTADLARVSTDSLGNPANGYSEEAVISGDGRYVAFRSLASNLVPGDTNGFEDVFVKDLQTGRISRASTDSTGNESNGHSLNAAISADGRYVAFRSSASNLVPDDTNGKFDIFMKDLSSGATSRVSTGSLGAEADGDSYDPSVSADGRYVAFWSVASNLVPGDTNGTPDVFVKDLWTGATTRVSTDSLGNQGNGASGGASISGDGRYVAFESFAGNLVPGDTSGFLGYKDVFIKDLATGATARVSLPNAGSEAGEDSYSPSISADGRYVTFVSEASLLGAGSPSQYADVYRAWNPFLAPEIRLYSSTVPENQPVETTVGVFSMAGAESGQSYTYTLTSGQGDADNALFILEGNALKATASFDFETRSSYSIRVRSTDGANVSYDQAITVTVTDVHDFASPALYDANTSTFYLRCANITGMADYTFAYGQTDAGWKTLAGDWDGDDTSGVGLYDPNTSTFYLTNAYESGYAQYTFGYGEGGKGWIPLVGDWNGDGRSGVGLYDPQTSTFYLTNSLATGVAEYSFGFGEANAGWTPLVGDWNGDRRTGVGLFNPHASTFYLTSTFQTGFAEHTFGYGEPDAGWQPLVGDWNGDHTDGVGLFAPKSSTFYLTDAFTGGYAQRTFGFGQPEANWIPLVGDWDGRGASGVGLYCPATSTFYLTATLASGYAEYTVGFGQPGANWQPLVGCWTTAGSQGQTYNAQAVDQLDLADLAAQELAPAVTLENLDLA